MSRRTRLSLAAIFVFIVVLIFLFNVRSILMPFVIGLASAYVLDPVADRMVERGIGRGLATALITATLVAALVFVLFLLLPFLLSQLIALAGAMPEYIRSLREWIEPYLLDLLEGTPLAEGFDQRELINRFSQKGFELVRGTFTSVVENGLAMINLVSLLFITPVVTFYTLKDWDRMRHALLAQVPPDHRDEVVKLATQVDEVLGGFLRGQAIVCTFLAVFYALGLWLVDLQYGIVIGLLTGIFSFIPLIGMTVGTAVGLLVAAFQFQSIAGVAIVAAVFITGNVIESNFMSPKLVGSRIHLHELWVMFAVLAGTALYGLLGTFLAVPVAAVIGVFVRYAFDRYRMSTMYLGES